MSNKTIPEEAKEKKFSKTVFIVSGSIALVGALLVALAAIPPKAPEPAPTQNLENQKTVDITRLEIQNLTKQTQTLNENIKKIYENQQSLQTSLTATITNIQTLQKESQDNREYIAKLYKRILDIELQLRTVGGGFNMKKSPPSIPQDQFPQSP